jgi:MerR family transcriptional regulator, thiopeptide resistance regulator
MFKVSEFAEKAGVTVRTLHHYDRLGLLKPSGRTQAGYRLYSEREFARE